MKALGFGGGVFGPWDMSFRRNNNEKKKKKTERSSRNGKESSWSSESRTCKASMFKFPLKQAITAGSLALTGDTIAQLSHRCRKILPSDSNDANKTHALLDKSTLWNLLADHDWIRALRMASYGFLLYGPGSYAWYKFLDHQLPKQTVQNIITKVVLNQIVLGPSVIAVIFAWNNLWQGKISELPDKYKNDALPTLLYGFRFWIPVSILNFWVVPLQARVAFMSLGSIFWNFILSSTMSK